MKNMCTRCGMDIIKSAIADPYLCRMCERVMTEEEIYAFLDTK